jgi:cytochrome oxidase Cu insertion factor (SCO1/SenC/PrrC family)
MPGEPRARNLHTLAALAALFLLPLALAFFTYYGTAWRPSAHVSHGRLLSPARPLPTVALPRIDLESQPAAETPEVTAAPFRKRWSLVYLGTGDCDAACRQALYVMRQTRLALNNEMTRVQRVFLVSRACCDRAFLAREHAGLLVLDAGAPAAESLLAPFPRADREHTLFIVDPLGNLMMSYDSRANPRGLLEDLKKLLALSHIG